MSGNFSVFFPKHSGKIFEIKRKIFHDPSTFAKAQISSKTAILFKFLLSSVPRIPHGVLPIPVQVWLAPGSLSAGLSRVDDRALPLRLQKFSFLGRRKWLFLTPRSCFVTLGDFHSNPQFWSSRWMNMTVRTETTFTPRYKFRSSLARNHYNMVLGS